VPPAGRDMALGQSEMFDIDGAHHWQRTRGRAKRSRDEIKRRPKAAPRNVAYHS
jgi:hypothetical protein